MTATINTERIRANNPRGFNYRRAVHEQLSTGMREDEVLTSTLPILGDARDLVATVSSDDAMSVSVFVDTPAANASEPAETFEVVAGTNDCRRYSGLPKDALRVRFVLKARRACKRVCIHTQFNNS